MSDTTAPPVPDTTSRIPVTGLLASRTRRSAVASVPKLEPGMYLAIPDGDDVVVVPIDQPVTRIGRSVGADLNLDDATVSRRHALVMVDGDGAKVVDDRSLNGIEVNGTRVREQRLQDGDVIGVGRVALRFVHVT